MPFALLLAMQAAGMITDWLGVQNQNELGEMGAKIQHAGVEASIEQTRLESADASLQAMQNLRKTLGAQAAIFAARGTKSGAGNTLEILTESIGNFNADERMRRINTMGRINQIKAGGLIGDLNASGARSKRWNEFGQRTINRFPSSKQGWEQGISDTKQGFGLTQK